jgi:predicted GH43/DUF377 family glycosyl hydrolase
MEIDLNKYIKRHFKNPIIKKENIPYECLHVLNPGAIKYNNKYYLLLRIVDMKNISHLGLAFSEDGINFEISKKIVLSPESLEEGKGIEDPRITKIEDKFYITYTAYSEKGAAVGLLETTDFKDFKRLGIILPPDNKDVVILPEKINGKYFAYHRPMSYIGKSFSIWTSTSPDLIHWGEHKPVLSSVNNSWDSDRVGAGAVPIKTEKGWLHIYHGVSQNVYRLGLALFDLKDPSKLIRRSENYILAPEKDYEKVGWISNVVFTCGAILEDNNEVKIYYGGADDSISLVTAKLKDLLYLVENY